MQVLNTHHVHCLVVIRDTVANRDSSITQRDANIVNLQKQTEAVADNLKVRSMQ